MLKILQQIPALEVIPAESKEPVTPIIDRVLNDRSLEEKKKFVVPSQLSRGAKRRHRRRAERGEERSTETESAGSPPPPQVHHKSSDSNVFAISTELDPTIPLTPDPEIKSRRKFVRVHSSQRHRHRKKSSSSSQVEAFKIVLGGLLAFPIAYLIIMWVFGQDPLSLGKSVGKVVPFAFPETFRASPEKAKSESKGNDPVTSETKSDPRSSMSNRSDVNANKNSETSSFDLNAPKLAPENNIPQYPDVAPGGEEEAGDNGDKDEAGSKLEPEDKQ